jgi:hypothetical protein
MSVVHNLKTLLTWSKLDQVSILLSKCLLLFMSLFCSYVKRLIGYSRYQAETFQILYYIYINLLKPTGYGMHQQVEYINNCTLCPYRIYVLCICLRTNSDLRNLHKKLIGSYNRDEKCLQRGTDWAFK